MISLNQKDNIQEEKNFWFDYNEHEKNVKKEKKLIARSIKETYYTSKI